MPAHDLFGPSADLDGEDRLAHAAKILIHLQSQLGELDRREQHVNQQLTLLMEQQRMTRRSQLEADEYAGKIYRAVDERTAELTVLEDAFQKRELALNHREQEFAARAQEFQRNWESFDEDQTRLRTDLLQEIEDERQALRNEFQAKQLALTHRRAELEQGFETRRASLADESVAIQLEHQRRHAEIFEQLERDRQQLTEERAELNRLREEQERLNLQWAEHRKEERRQHLEELETTRRERLAALDQRERELEQRDIDLQKRFRLHDAHLDRTRADLAAQRSQLEWQRQQQRSWIEDIEVSIRLRLGHIRRFRDLLTQREHCLAEEQQLFASQRQSIEEELTRQREQLGEERSTWLTDQEQATRVRQQRSNQIHDELQRLAGCHTELASLSKEFQSAIEQFQRDCQNLETGVALTTEPEQAASHASRLLSIVSRQLHELDESRRDMILRHQERRKEEVALSAWMEERETWFRNREESFQLQLISLAEQGREWNLERERWHSERIQAEHVIRNLVQQLEAVLEASPQPMPKSATQAAA